MILSDDTATLIHDLKTPIFAQERIIDLLLKNTFGELNSSQTDIISQLKESYKYLENIIYTAMNNYRSGKEQIDLKFEKFKFKDLLYSIIKEVSPLSESKNQKFNISCSDISVNGDMFHIKRVLVNLISNSIKYSYINSEIEITAKQDNDDFLFMIKNKSPQIDNPDRVFEKFESTTNSGLGLYLVKKVVKSHNGSVFVKQEGKNKYVFGFVIPNI